ncbi:LysR substrate-binding domain-containing protein [Marmoricola sp. RAF53]|uniref:LysR substrate-binding domain-containing protein n=1 Tax=Marmoricola sp. RAF53 TaxID=3233059 RepID=UPI003F9E9E46
MEDVTPLRVGYVPGVMPGKWERAWKELQRHRRTRHLDLVQTEVEDQTARLLDGTLDMCLARGERDREFDRDAYHVITLYREQPVVVVGVEHPVAAYDEIDVAELADEHDVMAANPGLAVRYGIETVAAGTGIVIVPMSLARLHNRKDVHWLPVHGVDDYPVSLVWLRKPPAGLGAEDAEAREEAIQMFIGVVRGRTANTSR